MGKCRSLQLNSGTSDRVAASQLQRPAFNPDLGCCLEFACSPCDLMAFLLVLRIPPTSQSTSPAVPPEPSKRTVALVHWTTVCKPCAPFLQLLFHHCCWAKHSAHPWSRWSSQPPEDQGRANKHHACDHSILSISKVNSLYVLCPSDGMLQRLQDKRSERIPTSSLAFHTQRGKRKEEYLAASACGLDTSFSTVCHNRRLRSKPLSWD